MSDNEQLTFEVEPEELGAYTSVEDENGNIKTTVEGLCPDLHVMLAPNGYIRVAAAVGILSTAFYLDGNGCRALADMLTEAAASFDEFEKLIAEVESESDLDNVSSAPALVVDEVEDEGEFETPDLVIVDSAAIDVPQ